MAEGEGERQAEYPGGYWMGTLANRKTVLAVEESSLMYAQADLLIIHIG